MTLQEEQSRFLEELMAHIIIAGGRRIEPAILAMKPLGEVIALIWPNSIVLKVESARPR